MKTISVLILIKTLCIDSGNFKDSYTEEVCINRVETCINKTLKEDWIKEYKKENQKARAFLYCARYHQLIKFY